MLPRHSLHAVVVSACLASACTTDRAHDVPLAPVDAHRGTSADGGPPGVTPIDLGTLGGSFSVAWAINERGVIAGTSQMPDGSTHLFVREADGTMYDAGVPSFAQYAFPAAISNDGVVAGVTDQPRKAFRWSRSRGFEALTMFAGDSWAMDINDRGEVVGFGEFAAGIGQQHAFLWPPDSAARLLQRPGASSTYAQAINNRGVVVGGGFDSVGVPRAIRWTAATGIVDLMAPGYANAATDINNRGTTIGAFQPLDGTMRGFRLDEPGRGTDLGLYRDGSFVSPIRIADDGTIVAVAIDRRGRYTPFRQRGGTREELLALTGAADVKGVNSCGRAVGWSQLPSGVQHAVLWPGWC